MDERREAQPRSVATGPAPIAPSLTSAIRKARIDQAEQSSVVAELRGAEMARLEMLHDALRPVLAQVPADIDLFDTGIVPGDRPRLFLDMIGYVEMSADRRGYRFVQDTRHGRVLLAESDRMDPIVEACTHYIARRMVERERALASDTLVPAVAASPASTLAVEKPVAAVGDIAAPNDVAPPRAPSRLRTALVNAAMFTIEFLGSIVLLILAAGAGYFIWTIATAWWITRNGQVG